MCNNHSSVQLSFKFSNAAERQIIDDGLIQMAAIAGIHRTEQLFPSDEDPVLSRLFIAYADPSYDLKGITTKIAAVPGIEFAEIPAPRGIKLPAQRR